MIETRPLVPFGCEVMLDLRERSTADEDELRALFDRHHLFVFRNQSLSRPQQADVMAIFGRVLPGDEGSGMVTNEVAPDNALGDGPLGFHSDLSFLPEPYQAISLHAIEVEDGKSSTMFVDTARAAARLPAELRARAAKAKTLQVISYDLGGSPDAGAEDTRAKYVHPVIRPHPRTGEDILTVSRNQTSRITNMDVETGRRLIEDLFELLYAPGEIYEHVWHRGDLVLFDNLALQHARGPVNDVGIRRLQRVVVAETGLFEQLPPGFVIETDAGRQRAFSQPS